MAERIKANGLTLTDGNIYDLIPPSPTEETRGGIKAKAKTTEVVEVVVGEDGKAYVPKYPSKLSEMEQDIVVGGEKGDKGDTGEAGKDGVSVTHSWSGTTLNITSASGTSSMDLKGDKGETGLQGKKGDPFVYSDFTQEQLNALKGDRGEQGTQGEKGETGLTGENGISVTHSWTGTTLNVTSASGTSSANLKGDKGDIGQTGLTGQTGDPGKSAYQYAVDNGYTGTESEFSTKLAKEDWISKIVLNGEYVAPDVYGVVNLQLATYYVDSAVPTNDIGNDDDLYLVVESVGE